MGSAHTTRTRTTIDKPEFFTFSPFFRKFFSNRSLAERIPEMDSWLGARVSGAGAELLATGKRPARGSAPERMAPSSAPERMAPSSAPFTLAPSYLHLTPAQPSSPSVLPLLSPRIFFSPLHPSSRIDILDLENLDLIRRSSRARYTRSPPCFSRIDSVHISRIFEPKNRHHLGFHCIPQYMYYTTIG